jgi:Tfp pilus assembly protein PilV
MEMKFHGPRNSWWRSAFTLIEVMIASAILFLCLFAILALLASSLRNARALRHTTVDAGMLAAELSLTNKLMEGSDSGDFGDVHPDYRWNREIYEVSSNGLYGVDFTIYSRSREVSRETHMSILLFRPDSTVTFGPGAPRPPIRR